MGGETGMPAGVASGVAEPECPRCGYDLSGQVAAAAGVAADSFPVGGQCSECGLEFAWGDVFNPGRDRVPGFIEQEEGGWRRVLRAVVSTWWLAIRPWTFWGKVRLEITPRVGRMGVWAGVLFPGVTWVAAVVTVLVLLLGWPQAWGQLKVIIVHNFSGGVLQLEAWRTVGRWRVGLPPGILALVVASMAAPAVFMCLPHTRRMSRVLPWHVLRGAVYGLAWLAPLAVLSAALRVIGTCVFTAAQAMGPGRGQWLIAAMRGLRWVGGVIHEGSWLLMVVGAAWLGAWWFFALRDGWRIREFSVVWWAVLVPSALAALVVLVLTEGHELFL
jgi:hypothetical protein